MVEHTFESFLLDLIMDEFSPSFWVVTITKCMFLVDLLFLPFTTLVVLASTDIYKE